MSEHEPARVTEHALAVARQAVDAPHGDNDPAATAALLIDRAVVDRQYPPVGDVPPGRPMCWAWGGGGG